MCKPPRLLHRYLAIMARNVNPTTEEQGVVEGATYCVGDTVDVLDDGEKYPGVIAKVYGEDDYEKAMYDIEFADGEIGRYGAEDFC